MWLALFRSFILSEVIMGGYGAEVWLKREIVNRLGDDRAGVLIGASYAYGKDRYAWLLDQINNEELRRDYEGWLGGHQKVNKYRQWRIKLASLEMLRESYISKRLDTDIDRLKKQIAGSKVSVEELCQKYRIEL